MHEKPPLTQPQSDLKTDVSDAKESVHEELITLLSRQGRRVPLPVFLSALLVAFLAANYVNHLLLVLWMLVVTGVLAVRWYVLGNLPVWTDLSAEVRVKIAIVLSAVNGTTHGISNLFFPETGAFEHALQTMLLLGLCAGSVATTAGHRGVFLAYLIPTIIPNALSWLFIGFLSEPLDWVPIMVSLLVAMFAGILIALAKDTFGSFNESFEIRTQQQETNAQLELALVQAESANSAKTRFLASASHDLRQPIHTLSLLGASLSMRPLDERSKQISNHINTALDSLATQLDSLLDISKLDAGIVETNDSTLDLSALCLRLQDEFGTSAASKGLKLNSMIETDAVVYTDATLLERILRNLLSNAIKYTEQGQVSIGLSRKSATQYQISVSDTGMGISEEDQKLIFEEFYQVDNPERDRNKGLGLGLAIVKRLLSLLSLQIQIESSIGQGTKFTIFIDSVLHEMPHVLRTQNHTLDWSQFVVLVIDDEAMVRFAVETLLSELGATVQTADSQNEAIKIAETQTPNLVLADFRLRANESGLDAVTALQALYPRLPAILISGDTGPERLQQAKKAGIPFLHKPVKVEELEEAILTFAQLGNENYGEHFRPDKDFEAKHTLKRL